VLQVTTVSSANQIYLFTNFTEHKKKLVIPTVVRNPALGLQCLEIFLSVAFLTKKEESKQFSNLILCTQIYIYFCSIHYGLLGNQIIFTLEKWVWSFHTWPQKL